MAANALRFLSLLLTALSLGGGIGHVLELPNKLALPAAFWLPVQQTLYEGWGRVLGPVEYGAFLSSAALLVAVRHQPRALALVGIAMACMGASLVIWQLYNGPVNAAVAAWTVQTLPADWTAFRDRWEYAHVARAALNLGAFCTLLLATLPTARHSPKRQVGSSLRAVADAP